SGRRGTRPGGRRTYAWGDGSENCSYIAASGNGLIITHRFRPPMATPGRAGNWVNCARRLTPLRVVPAARPPAGVENSPCPRGTMGRPTDAGPPRRAYWSVAAPALPI